MPTFISNVTNKICSADQGVAESAVAERVCRRLHGCDPFNVKHDGAIINKAAYMVIGIDLDGDKEVLGMWIGEKETS
ncbi:Transposase, Mutator family [compost metagenome]